MITAKALFEILSFFGSYAAEIESYGEGEITVNMDDVNLQIEDEIVEQTEKYTEWSMIGWEEYLQRLVGDDVKLTFRYGDGNWVTIGYEE